MESLPILDFFIVALMLLLFFVAAGLKKFGHKITSMFEYMTAGRRITLPFFVITLVSSWYGSVMGATQIAYKYGIYNFIIMGVFWYISAIIFAIFISGKLRATNAMSLVDIITNLYGKSSGKIVMGMMYIKTMPVPYFIGVSIFISALFGVDHVYAIIITAIIAIFFSSKGGLSSVIFVDIIQFCIIFVAMGLVVWCSYSELGGLDYLIAKLPESHFMINGDNSWDKMLLWFVIALSTTVLSPIFHQRCFAAKDAYTAKAGVFISIVFWACSDILTTLGGLYAMALIGPGKQDAYMQLISQVAPSGIKGFIMGALIITAYSALDSYVFACKSIMVNGLYKGKKISSYGVFSIGVITSVVSAILAMHFRGDIESAFIAFECAFIGSMLIPTVISLLHKNILTKKAFNSVVLSTFIIACVLELFYPQDGSTNVISILIINVALICVFRWCSINNLKEKVLYYLPK